MPHVFVSYVREDASQVNRLCADLAQFGVKVWLDKDNIKPGARWKDAIRDAIKGAITLWHVSPRIMLVDHLPPKPT